MQSVWGTVRKAVLMDLHWLINYVSRNPYTGAPIVDLAALEESKEFQKLLSVVWESGYDSGFTDGIDDSSVETQTRNPYKN